MYNVYIAVTNPAMSLLKVCLKYNAIYETLILHEQQILLNQIKGIKMKYII